MIIIIIIIIIVIINSVKISAGRYTKEERGKLERRWSDRDVKKNETFYVWRPLLKAGGEKAKKKEEKKGKKEKTLRHRTCHPDWIFFLLCGFPFSFRKKKINEEFQGKFQEEPLWVVPSLSLDFHWWWYTMVFFSIIWLISLFFYSSSIQWNWDWFLWRWAEFLVLMGDIGVDLEIGLWNLEGFYWFLRDFTELYWAFIDFTRFYLILPGSVFLFIDSNRVSLKILLFF